MSYSEIHRNKNETFVFQNTGCVLHETVATAGNFSHRNSKSPLLLSSSISVAVSGIKGFGAGLVCVPPSPAALSKRNPHFQTFSLQIPLIFQFSTLASDILILSHLNLISHHLFPLQPSPSNSTLRSCLQMFFSLNL